MLPRSIAEHGLNEMMNGFGSFQSLLLPERDICSVGAAAGLPSSACPKDTAGLASSGTRPVILSGWILNG